MSRSRIAWLALASALVVGPALLAQTGDQSAPAPDQPSLATPAQIDTKATQLFTGCLMTEPAYRRAHSLGSGALGGAGLGDEFVLVDAKTSPATTSSTSDMKAREMKAIAANAKPVTTPCPDKGMAVRVTGSAEESWMKNLVGHWLEINGKYKHADDILPDGTQKGTKLPAEVEMISARELPAPGPAPVTEPVMKPATPPPAPQPEPKVANPPPPPPAATTTPAEPKAMPHTAGPNATVGLIGLLALTSGLTLMLVRRRRA